MTFHIEQRGETERLNEELARLQRCRVLAAWAEIKAERQAREARQMACVAPRIEESEDNG
jgi:hypothetical protein